MIGTKLAHYEITSHLGTGGMGEVYQAIDSKLGRGVAIKLLPAAFASEPERLSRFRREAQVLASLNHPNIAHIYGLEESGDTRCIVMELIEGETLQSRIKQGPIPVDEALTIAKQICDALEAAHERGVVHRDLKPGNVMLTSDGAVKVLDFGLAKAYDSNSSNPAMSNSPTMASMAATNAGVILGTAAYMSPEQARGKAVDKRADIWAFGVVLYEMVMGRQLFQGEDQTVTLASVVMKEPDLTVVPQRVRRVLERCLEKDPKKRLRDISGVESLLDETSTPIAVGGGKTARLPWTVAAVSTIAALALGIALWAPWRSEKLADRPLVRLDVDLGTDVSLSPIANTGNMQGSSVAISPDGMRLVYVSGTTDIRRGIVTPSKLFTRRLDQSKATELPGTQGAAAPFFSTDGQWIGFQAGSKLNKISVDGGAVVPLGNVGFILGANWGEDGNIFVGTTKGLLRIRDGGGQPETVAELANAERGLLFPQILPGSKAVLFSAYTESTPDASSIEVMTLADHHRKTVSRGGTSPRYLATSNGSGYLVYLNKATLFAVPFDLDKLETRGTALPIVDDVASNGVFGTAQLSVSQTGTLVYRRGGGNDSLLTVAWLESTGNQPLLAKPGAYGRLSLSPDGQRLALEVTEGSGTDIWVYEWERDTMTRFTFNGKAGAPVWSPDGRYIVFWAFGEGISAIRSDGAGELQALTHSKNSLLPWSFTPDGKRLAFVEADPKTSYDLWTVPLESDSSGLRAGKPEVFLQTPKAELYPSLSPDGRWMAYCSDEAGISQIYVRAFPDKGGKWQISNSGGAYPMWSRSGHELLFESPDQHIMAASYAVKGDSFVADKPRLWSEKPIGGTLGTKNVDLAPDGKRIVALMPANDKSSQEAQNHVTFLENFFDELRRRVPTGK